MHLSQGKASSPPDKAGTLVDERTAGDLHKPHGRHSSNLALSSDCSADGGSGRVPAAHSGHPMDLGHPFQGVDPGKPDVIASDNAWCQ